MSVDISGTAELKLVQRKNIKSTCLHKTIYYISKARYICAEYTLHYHGVVAMINGVGIRLCEQLKARVLRVDRKCDGVIRVILEMECGVWNIVRC